MFDAAGQNHLFVSEQEAADAGDLPALRFLGGENGGRLVLRIQVTGTGALTCKLVPVVRIGRKAGYDDDAFPGQFQGKDQEVTLTGNDAVYEFRMFQIPKGMEVAVRVTELTGTDAKVSVWGGIEHEL